MDWPEPLSYNITGESYLSFNQASEAKKHGGFGGIYFMVRHIDISSLLIRSKHCENESGDCIYPGRLYVSYHEAYTDLGLC